MPRPGLRLATLALATVLSTSGVLAVVAAPAATAKAKPGPTAHRDIGTMVDPYASGRPGFDGARITARVARTVSVSPTSGPDFEMPFRCGEAWVGSTRNSHSPSRYSIDFNRSGDVGRPVLASAPGVVYRVARAGGYGNYVIIDHGNGYSTLYAHMRATNVSVGQAVDQAETVGFVGSTGRVTGPHLHFEMRLNGNYFAPYLHRAKFVFNRTLVSQNCGDVPLVGDWDGDGTDDLGVYRRRPGVARNYLRLATGTRTVDFGRSGNYPFVGDWDGNGVSQLGARATQSIRFQLLGEDGRTSLASMGGAARDIPLAGSWTGGTKDGLGLYSPAARRFTLRLPDLSRRTIAFGGSGLKPVIGDWDGDGTDDVGTFDVRTGRWQMRLANGTVKRLTYGGAWDLPVAGDWNGDGVTDLGYWRPRNATFHQRIVNDPGTVSARSTFRTVQFGAPRG